MSPHRVAIVQSSYIPWRGTFALIAQCDAYVFLDTVQYTTQDWRNRNRIKTPNGPRWLSLPVRRGGLTRKPIDTVEIADSAWAGEHLHRLETAYARAPAFDDTIAAVRQAYAAVADEPMLSRVNQTMIRALCELMGITTPMVRDVDLIPRETLASFGATERLVELTLAAGAQRYLSGPTARAYLDTDQFTARGVGVDWMSYDALPPYPQLWGEYEPSVSVLDPLLTLGHATARSWLGL